MNTTSVLKSVNLCWFYLDSFKYAKNEKIDHMSLGYSVGGDFFSGRSSCKVLLNKDKSRLATIYAKHSVSVACSVVFSGVFWAKIAGESLFPPLSIHNNLVNSGSSSEIKPILPVTSDVKKRFAVLENSLISFTEQISELVKRLNSLVPAVSQPSPGLGNVVIGESSGGTTDGKTAVSLDFSAFLEVKRLENMLEGLSASVLSLTAGMNNSAKQDDVICWHKDMNNLILIFIKTKLKGKVHLWIANKFDGVRVFISDLNSGYLGSGVAIIMDNSLVRYIYKISEVSEWLFSIRLLFKNKLSVSILRLYAGTSLDSFFIVLSGNFNEDGLCKSASFKKCLDLSLTIDYIFISYNLVSAVINYGVANVSNYFDSDHKAVSVCKFDVKNANKAKWLEFKDAMATNTSMFMNKFDVAIRFSDLNTMWDIVYKIMILLVNETFKKKWFKSFGDVFTKMTSRFYKLELLNILDSVSALMVKALFFSDSNFDTICSVLAKVKKLYCSSKLLEFKHAEESFIKQAINKRIKSFELDKNHTIRNVLEHPFYKVTLNYLVVRDKLILEPNLVKSKMNNIMEEWTRKHRGVLMNTHPIALIETVYKILFKVLLNRISSACSTFNVLYGDNFSVLKGMTTQSSIFTIGSVIEDALEKNRELWLVLQNMRKAYNSGLKSKSGLPLDFSNDALYYPFLYGLKTFEQIQAKSKSASIVSFVNSVGILDGLASSDILWSHAFSVVSENLLHASTACLFVYTDRFLSGLDTFGMRAGAAVYFEDVDLDIGVRVSGLVSSMIAELQAIALALKCILSFCLVDLFLDSQAALDAYKSEFLLISLDFRNQCWIEYCHVVNIIHCKNLDVK
ncbi:hypothetical protein G9A89_001507 [Geosiphon pyriformis]|nr:hypothetical protein G9A89_001507 [Geosiphon pyriformis]